MYHMMYRYCTLKLRYSFFWIWNYKTLNVSQLKILEWWHFNFFHNHELRPFHDLSPIHWFATDLVLGFPFSDHESLGTNLYAPAEILTLILRQLVQSGTWINSFFYKKSFFKLKLTLKNNQKTKQISTRILFVVVEAL